jgi:F420-non-reducing hydrogenase iron-sulfur subunit
MQNDVMSNDVMHSDALGNQAAGNGGTGTRVTGKNDTQPAAPDLFEPVLIAFVCNWCTYTAADLAGTSRLVYPDNVRLVRVMCTGMVDTQYVIKAFLEGADAVLVSGCHPGDCHYLNGNYKARRRIKLLKQILPRFGIATQRLRLTWIGASDGIQFARTMTEFAAEIQKMGPCRTRRHQVL